MSGLCRDSQAGIAGCTPASLARVDSCAFRGRREGTGQDLGDEACSHSLVTRSACIRSLKTDVSVTAVKDNALAFQARIGQIALKRVFVIVGPKDRRGVP